MAPDLEPRELVAGDKWEWTRSLLDYPADQGWSLKYFLRGNATGATVDITATADGANFKIVLAAATTANLPAGTYTFLARVEKGTDKYTVGQGFIEIRPNLEAQEAPFDGRTHVKKTLDAINAVLEKTAGRYELEYEIDGRRLRMRSTDELLRLKHRYERLWELEQRKAGQRPRRKRLLTSFSDS